MRTAQVEQTCPSCGGIIRASEPISGAVVGDMTRWVRPDCARNHRPPSSPDEPPRPVLSTPTPAAEQREALRWARARLETMRRDGWSGDDTAELRRLRAAWPGPGRHLCTTSRAPG